MTFTQFSLWMDEIGNVMELENGESKVSGKAAVDMAMNDPAIRKK